MAWARATSRRIIRDFIPNKLIFLENAIVISAALEFQCVLPWARGLTDRGSLSNPRRKSNMCQIAPNCHPRFASKNGSDAISMMFTAAQVAPINLA